MNRIADPPRALPLTLQLEVLAHRDVTGNLLYLVPAVLLQIAGAMHPNPHVRVAFFIFSALFIVVVLVTLPSALYRRWSTLRRMRYGILAAGRIRTCRLSWDRPGAAMPYRDFLGDWAAIVARSQTAKFTGCLARVVILVFAVPFVLMALMLVLIWGAMYFSGSIGKGQAVDFDGLYVAQWLAGTCVVVAVIGLILQLFRRNMQKAASELIEGHRIELRRAAGLPLFPDDAPPDQPDAPVVLKEPLPVDGAGVLLSCSVEFKVIGEPRTAAATAPLSVRLNLKGEEQLLFDPAHQSRVELLVNLPAAARVDAHGEWIPVSGYLAAVLLALTGGLAVAVTTALWLNLQSPLYQLWQTFGPG